MSKEIFEKLKAAVDGAPEGSESIEVSLEDANAILGLANGGTKQVKAEPEKPDTANDLKENSKPSLNPLEPASIAETLSELRQKARKGVAKGKQIPQMEITATDVQKALEKVKGVTEDYIEEYGFLTHIWLNAAKRTQRDVSKYEPGLFVKFVSK